MPLFRQKVTIIFQLFALFPREMFKKNFRFFEAFFSKKTRFAGFIKREKCQK